MDFLIDYLLSSNFVASIGANAASSSLLGLLNKLYSKFTGKDNSIPAILEKVREGQQLNDGEKTKLKSAFSDAFKQNPELAEELKSHLKSSVTIDLNPTIVEKLEVFLNSFTLSIPLKGTQLRPCLPELKKIDISCDDAGLWPLFAQARYIPLIGREHEISRMDAFLADNRKIAIAVISGSGGRGKTRLALDFCDKAASQGWDIVFSPVEATLTRFLKHKQLEDWHNTKPSIIVIDCAASFCALLKPWIQILCERKDEWSEKLRIVLIERQASFQSGWLRDICGEDSSQPISCRLLFTLELPLVSELPADVKNEIYISTLESLTGQHCSEEEKKESKAKLELKKWANEPLYLIMAALCCFDQTCRKATRSELNICEALDWGRSQLVFEVVRIEANRFEKIAESKSLNISLFKHLAACITLVGGMDRESFNKFIDNEAVASRHTNQPLLRPEMDKYFEGLKLALPNIFEGQDKEVKSLQAILPDAVGEAFVMSQLADPVPATQRCYEFNPRHALFTLGRAAMDFGNFDFKKLRDEYNILDIKKSLEEILAKARGDVGALKKLTENLPPKSLMLRAFAADAFEALVNNLRENLHHNAPDGEAEFAAILHRFGNRCGELDDRTHDALNSTLEAAAIRRKLSEADPITFLPHLTASLNNLGVFYYRMNENEKSLDSFKEAVDKYRELTELTQNFRSDLAVSLNNLGSHYCKLKQKATPRNITPEEAEKAFCAFNEAVEILENLSKISPDISLPNLAMVQHNLGNYYIEIKEKDKALVSISEAIRIRRQLSETNPDAYLNTLANSYHNLGTCYLNLAPDTEDLRKAHDSFKEAVDIRRKLSESFPHDFLPELSKSLKSLYKCRHGLGQKEKKECIVELRDIKHKRAALLKTDKNINATA